MMSRFMFVYHGGSTPASEDEQQKVMAAWMTWIESHGASFVEAGAPIGDNRTVSAAGVTADGGANPATGYGFVTADSIEAATKIAKGCPIVADGGSVEVASVFGM